MRILYVVLFTMHVNFKSGLCGVDADTSSDEDITQVPGGRILQQLDI